MTTENILTETAGGIGRITINRPEVRNALDPESWRELAQAVEALAADKEVGVIIITGAGEKSFVAGADISRMQERTIFDGFEAPSQHALTRLENTEKPIIAAINGFALGGGCELALACDIRIASDRAKLGQPEVNLGIMPGAGGTQRLASLVGVGKAKELIFTGEIIDAAEAERIGLVNKVVPHDELMDAVREMAQKILSKAPLAVRMAKIAINARIKWGPGAGMQVERLGQTALITTEDMQEGTGAFLEKRPPRFKGR